MLFIVTNRKLVKHGDLFSKIELASLAGADAIILREKDLEDDDLLKIAKSIKEITDRSKTPLIISKSLSVARAINATGVHLSFELFRKEKKSYNGLTGVSVHSVEEGKRAQALGANYILAGHIYNTDCKKGIEPRGISFIEELKDSIDIPIIAIGGINELNCREAIKSGAHGIAIMSSIMEAVDCYSKVMNIKILLKK